MSESPSQRPGHLPPKRAPSTLWTPRTIGRRIMPTDLADFQAFYADPAVMATLSADGKVWPARESAELFERHLKHWESHGFGTWIFRNPDNGSFIGRAGLRSVDVGRGPEVELFYGVDSSQWGRGLATEMAREIVRAAFEDLELDGLVCFTLPTNERSQRVMQKCGFVREGEFVHAELLHFLSRLSPTRWRALQRPS